MCFGSTPKMPPPPPPAPPPPNPMAISTQPAPTSAATEAASQQGMVSSAKRGKSMLTIPLGGTGSQTGLGY